MVASHIEAAACAGSVFALLRYLDGPLKSVAKTSFSIADTNAHSNPDRTEALYTMKNVGYSYKQVRKQVLIWLGNSFNASLLDRNPKTLEGQINLDLVFTLIDHAPPCLVSDILWYSTSQAVRYKDLLSNEDNFQARLRLDDGEAFPYRLWEVTKWGPSNDHRHPVIQCVQVGWVRVNRRELGGSSGTVPVDQVVLPEPELAKNVAQAHLARKKLASKLATKKVPSKKVEPGTEVSTFVHEDNSVYEKKEEPLTKGQGNSRRRAK
jgi:hypothetical protein